MMAMTATIMMKLMICVQYFELPGDCGVPVGHGGDDHAAHAAQGHCPLQPDGQCCELVPPYPPPPPPSPNPPAPPVVLPYFRRATALLMV